MSWRKVITFPTIGPESSETDRVAGGSRKTASRRAGMSVSRIASRACARGKRCDSIAETRSHFGEGQHRHQSDAGYECYCTGP